MNNIEFIDKFKELWEHSENEVVEFKKAETNFDVDELGKYFSALSNEANLREHEFAWIVFGVWDKKHQIIGTSFKDGEVALNRLKQDNALEHKGPQFHYRNECLCRGMVNFNMIDTVGRGIKKIYTEQRNRFFPMPDYDIDNEHRTVGVRSFLRSLRSFLRSLRLFSVVLSRSFGRSLQVTLQIKL